MNSFFTVFSFHFKENVKSKPFIITSVVLFLLIFGFFGITHFVDSDSKQEIMVYNESTVYDLAQQEAYDFVSITKEELEQMKQRVGEGDADGLIVLSDAGEEPDIQYYFYRSPDVALLSILTMDLQNQYIHHIAEVEGISTESALTLTKTINIEQEPLKTSDSLGLVYFFLFLMYMFIIMFGQMVAMGVSGEKTTRVMEMMITKAKPITMLYAKIASSLVSGILQFAVVAAGYFMASFVGWTGGEVSIFGLPLALDVITIDVFAYFLLYFVLGYGIYGLLFAAIASVTSRVEDMGNVIFPVTILLVGGFILGIRTMWDPSDTLVLIGSYVPFFSPLVTFSRIVLGEAGPLEIAATTSIMILTILLIGFLSNRIYTKGVHRYSEKTSIKDLFKLIKK